MDKIITEINKAWNWKGFNATKIILTNDFGNVIYKTNENEYWRICPEETSCEKIAKTDLEFERLSTDSEFIEDWEMSNLVTIAKSELGELEENQKYCLKMPANIGGEYNKSNIGKISFTELISFSGDLGFQIKDLKDGQKIKLNIKN
jgi:hypothetical protein